MADFSALIVAAGSGSRFAASVPKQYASLAGHPMLWYSLRAFCGHPAIARIFVVLDPADATYERHEWHSLNRPAIPLYCGGATRAASVRQGLEGIAAQVSSDEWILVHDAARPCIHRASIDALISAAKNEEAGALLAIPVADTLKRADGERRVLRTESREALWQAQTPQMFRYDILLKALQNADLARVTDEASAVEQMGYQPKLVHGSPANVKVTYPEDLRMAEMILKISDP